MDALEPSLTQPGPLTTGVPGQPPRATGIRQELLRVARRLRCAAGSLSGAAPRARLPGTQGARRAAVDRGGSPQGRWRSSGARIFQDFLGNDEYFHRFS